MHPSTQSARLPSGRRQRDISALGEVEKSIRAVQLRQVALYSQGPLKISESVLLASPHLRREHPPTPVQATATSAAAAGRPDTSDSIRRSNETVASSAVALVSQPQLPPRLSQSAARLRVVAPALARSLQMPHTSRPPTGEAHARASTSKTNIAVPPGRLGSATAHEGSSSSRQRRASPTFAPTSTTGVDNSSGSSALVVVAVEKSEPATTTATKKLSLRMATIPSAPAMRVLPNATSPSSSPTRKRNEGSGVNDPTAKTTTTTTTTVDEPRSRGEGSSGSPLHASLLHVGQERTWEEELHERTRGNVSVLLPEELGVHITASEPAARWAPTVYDKDNIAQYWLSKAKNMDEFMSKRVSIMSLDTCRATAQASLHQGEELLQLLNERKQPPRVERYRESLGNAVNRIIFEVSRRHLIARDMQLKEEEALRKQEEEEEQRLEREEANAAAAEQQQQSQSQITDRRRLSGAVGDDSLNVVNGSPTSADSAGTAGGGAGMPKKRKKLRKRRTSLLDGGLDYRDESGLSGTALKFNSNLQTILEAVEPSDALLELIGEGGASGASDDEVLHGSTRRPSGLETDPFAVLSKRVLQMQSAALAFPRPIRSGITPRSHVSGGATSDSQPLRGLSSFLGEPIGGRSHDAQGLNLPQFLLDAGAEKDAATRPSSSSSSSLSVPLSPIFTTAPASPQKPIHSSYPSGRSAAVAANTSSNILLGSLGAMGSNSIGSGRFAAPTLSIPAAAPAEPQSMFDASETALKALLETAEDRERFEEMNCLTEVAEQTVAALKVMYETQAYQSYVRMQDTRMLLRPREAIDGGSLHRSPRNGATGRHGSDTGATSRASSPDHDAPRLQALDDDAEAKLLLEARLTAAAAAAQSRDSVAASGAPSKDKKKRALDFANLRQSTPQPTGAGTSSDGNASLSATDLERIFGVTGTLIDEGPIDNDVRFAFYGNHGVPIAGATETLPGGGQGVAAPQNKFPSSPRSIKPVGSGGSFGHAATSPRQRQPSPTAANMAFKTVTYWLKNPTDQDVVSIYLTVVAKRQKHCNITPLKCLAAPNRPNSYIVRLLPRTMVEVLRWEYSTSTAPTDEGSAPSSATEAAPDGVGAPPVSPKDMRYEVDAVVLKREKRGGGAKDAEEGQSPVTGNSGPLAGGASSTVPTPSPGVSRNVSFQRPRPSPNTGTTPIISEESSLQREDRKRQERAELLKHAMQATGQRRTSLTTDYSFDVSPSGHYVSRRGSSASANTSTVSDERLPGGSSSSNRMTKQSSTLKRIKSKGGSRSGATSSVRNPSKTRRTSAIADAEVGDAPSSLLPAIVHSGGTTSAERNSISPPSIVTESTTDVVSASFAVGDIAQGSVGKRRRTKRTSLDKGDSSISQEESPDDESTGPSGSANRKPPRKQRSASLTLDTNLLSADNAKKRRHTRKRGSDGSTNHAGTPQSHFLQRFDGEVDADHEISDDTAQLVSHALFSAGGVEVTLTSEQEASRASESDDYYSTLLPANDVKKPSTHRAWDDEGIDETALYDALFQDSTEADAEKLRQERERNAQLVAAARRSGGRSGGSAGSPRHGNDSMGETLTDSMIASSAAPFAPASSSMKPHDPLDALLLKSASKHANGSNGGDSDADDMSPAKLALLRRQRAAAAAAAAASSASVRSDAIAESDAGLIGSSQSFDAPSEGDGLSAADRPKAISVLGDEGQHADQVVRGWRHRSSTGRSPTVSPRASDAGGGGKRGSSSRGGDKGVDGTRRTPAHSPSVSDDGDGGASRSGRISPRAIAEEADMKNEVLEHVLGAARPKRSSALAPSSTPTSRGQTVRAEHAGGGENVVRAASLTPPLSPASAQTPSPRHTAAHSSYGAPSPSRHGADDARWTVVHGDPGSNSPQHQQLSLPESKTLVSRDGQPTTSSQHGNDKADVDGAHRVHHDAAAAIRTQIRQVGEAIKSGVAGQRAGGVAHPRTGAAVGGPHANDPIDAASRELRRHVARLVERESGGAAANSRGRGTTTLTVPTARRATRNQRHQPPRSFNASSRSRPTSLHQHAGGGMLGAASGGDHHPSMDDGQDTDAANKSNDGHEDKDNDDDTEFELDAGEEKALRAAFENDPMRVSEVIADLTTSIAKRLEDAAADGARNSAKHDGDDATRTAEGGALHPVEAENGSTQLEGGGVEGSDVQPLGDTVIAMPSEELQRYRSYIPPASDREKRDAAAAEAARLLREQETLRRVVGTIISEVSQMWPEISAAAEGVRKADFLHVSLNAAWSVQRKAALNVHRLIRLLERKVSGRGWFPRYTTEDTLVDDPVPSGATPGRSTRTAGGAVRGRLRANVNHLHESLARIDAAAAHRNFGGDGVGMMLLRGSGAAAPGAMGVRAPNSASHGGGRSGGDPHQPIQPHVPHAVPVDVMSELLHEVTDVVAVETLNDASSSSAQWTVLPSAVVRDGVRVPQPPLSLKPQGTGRPVLHRGDDGAGSGGSDLFSTSTTSGPVPHQFLFGYEIPRSGASDDAPSAKARAAARLHAIRHERLTYHLALRLGLFRD